ncbi:MAG: hypothetical protein N2315_07240, partial [Thermanaerothrix sp.]|nr:hypothetical protein [Thermanaerothrix sp.]
DVYKRQVLSAGLLWFDRPGAVYSVSFLVLGVFGVLSRLYGGTFTVFLRLAGVLCVGWCLVLWVFGLVVALSWPFGMPMGDVVVLLFILVWEALLIVSSGVSILRWGR